MEREEIATDCRRGYKTKVGRGGRKRKEFSRLTPRPQSSLALFSLSLSSYFTTRAKSSTLAQAINTLNKLSQLSQ